ncbi:hypothetical protein PpBr36_04429 [Pyricularia pennisetigena]|uniref:hypothetical protein n=1 Tax=Pyricularia pennisetigena TaxID=1578925 RepID=UPI00114DFE14|nr:hypothetical protein PpBr36_04429 [Pyricularia pennisetigena]TLS26647.1 hypothetical protein PpBr36_04429 [Pyricularia pennisetigena]
MLTRSASHHGSSSDLYVSNRLLNNPGQRSGSLTAATAPSSSSFPPESASSSPPHHRSTPESPSPSSTLGHPAASRKRGPSTLDLETHTDGGSSGRPRVEPIQIRSPKGDHICLCTPAPKIRRPRNAFILYRTHHQARIVAENPKLPNPEISKIIGLQWHDEPESVKETWKRLAEEDKRKHARLYPNYKFQPRRGGKPGSAARTSSLSEGSDPSHCVNCGGRSITTPNTPPLPGSVLTPVAMSHKMAGGPHSSQSIYPPSGRAGPEHAYPSGRFIFGEEREVISSPSKRPRLDSDGAYYHHPMQSPPPPQHPQSPYTSGPARIRYEQHGRHPSVVRRQSQNYRNPADSNGYPPPPGHSQSQQYRGTMAPPPPPPPAALRPSLGFGPDRRPTPSQPQFDESLRLPPLQSRAEPQKPQQTQPSLQQKSQHSPVSQRHHAHQPSTTAPPPALATTAAISQREIEARSVEAMVMSIPYANKLQVLERISPPLAPPGPSSPVVETRGPIVAIEGSHPGLMEAVGMILQRVLEESRECAVKTWSDGKPPATTAGDHVMEEQPQDAASTPDGDRTPRAGEKRTAANAVIEDNTSDTLEATNSVAESDAEMSDAPSVSRRKSSSDESAAQQPGGLSAFLPYLGKIQEWHRRSDEIVKFVTTKPVGASGRDNRTPVALITGGFSLHISDWFASRVSITDAYAPVDHWQWMATLWRGIVGPDLVVYVRKSKAEDIRAFGAVEVKSPRLIVVRVDPPVGEVQPRLSESMKRRVGFEIMEWVRGGSFRQGF